MTNLHIFYAVFRDTPLSTLFVRFDKNGCVQLSLQLCSSKQADRGLCRVSTPAHGFENSLNCLCTARRKSSEHKGRPSGPQPRVMYCVSRLAKIDLTRPRKNMPQSNRRVLSIFIAGAFSTWCRMASPAEIGTVTVGLDSPLTLAGKMYLKSANFE